MYSVPTTLHWTPKLGCVGKVFAVSRPVSCLPTVPHFNTGERYESLEEMPKLNWINLWNPMPGSW